MALFLLGGLANCTAALPNNDGMVERHKDSGFGVHIGGWDVNDDGGVLFLFGAFCALWAQNTRRNPWAWFFLGLFFSVVTVIVLLVKNSDDNFDRRMYGRTTRDLQETDRDKL